jgi:hypothetical protein
MQPLVHWLLQQPTQSIAQVDTLVHHVDKCGGGDGAEGWVCCCSVGGEHCGAVSCVIVPMPLCCEEL